MVTLTLSPRRGDGISPVNLARRARSPDVGSEVSAKIGCALISSNAVSGEYTEDQTIEETEEQIQSTGQVPWSFHT